MQKSTSPSANAVAVTPHDTTAIVGGPTRYLYIGGAGNVTVITRKGQTVLFTAVPLGTVLPIQASHVKSTGTTATAIVALL